nr:PREDICTED: membrane protein FAM174B-like isoform X2 [Bemisia tabaci]XP_018906723.1 PREDICTED: membrane protein FAM174B-like isoform X2 [Bemisia tabaci]
MEKKVVVEVHKDVIKPLKQNISLPIDFQHSNSTFFKSLNHFSSIPENLASVKEFYIFYIFIGLSVIILLIFILRAMRFRSKKSTRIRRYGIVTSTGDVEMMPLDNEDDDEEATVFDITDHSSPQP